MKLTYKSTVGLNVNSNVLVVEDEEPIRELIKYTLEKEGYSVETCNSGEEAFDSLKKNQPNLVVLDIMLPGINGLEICRRIKQDSILQKISVVMLSALGEESDVITGLEIGADDYIPKPFSPKLLSARVKTVLRRKDVFKQNLDEDVTVHGIALCPGRFEVKVADEKIELTATEFKILNFLARHPGWVFTRYQIVDAVRGEDYPVTERSVDVQIVGIRKKLGASGDIIETVRGVGYRVRE